jgi:hypothetical protein
MILTILEGSGSHQPGRERKRYLQIGLLALALLLVGVLGFRQVQRLMNQREVWVASSDLPAGSTVGPQNLKRVKLSESALPKGTLADANAIAGRELSRAKQAGEPFVGGDFQGQEQAAAVAEMVPEGRVLQTIRVSRATVPYRNLKAGDRLDLISGGHVVAHDAYLVGQLVPKPPPPPSGRASLIPPGLTQNTSSPTIGLILAVHPEHALPLARATAGRGSVQIVLHGKTEVASGQLIVLPQRYPVEYIAGARRTQLVTP